MTAPTPQVPFGQPTSGSTATLEWKFPDDNRAAVTVALSAAAAVGATTLAVTALTGDVDAGGVLHFTAGDAIVIVKAESGDTAVEVLPLDAALASGASVAYDHFRTIPVLGTVNLAISPTDATYQAYASSGDDVWDFATKVASNAKLDFKTAAPDNDPAVQPLVERGLKSGKAAAILFRRRRASGSWYYGYSTLGTNISDPERGIAETMFTGTVSGRLRFQAAPAT